jgi:hypothetical protein
MRRLVAFVLGATLLMSSAAAVSADSVYVVRPIACALFEGGATTADAGSPISLSDGWLATTRGQIVAFMQASTWVLTVNGTPVDVRPYLTGPFQVDTKLWEVTWLVPTGIALRVGDTMNLSEELILNHPNYDGFSLNARGSYFGGPESCIVTGAVPPPPE